MTDTQPTPAQHRADQRRRVNQLARTESARQTFVDLERGCELLCLTYGQFSLIDAIDALLDHTGPADVDITVWTAATFDLALTDRLHDAGRIRNIRWVVDRSFRTRHRVYYEQLVGRFGAANVRTTRGHAKLVTIRNDTWDLVVRTSMNLNLNERLETIEVSDDAALADFVGRFFDDVYAAQPEGTHDGELPAAPAAPTRLRSGRFVRMGAD